MALKAARPYTALIAFDANYNALPTLFYGQRKLPSYSQCQLDFSFRAFSALNNRPAWA